MTPPRLFHACGPGDVVDSFRHWRAGRSFLSETSIPYTAQFFAFCRDHGIAAHVVSSHPRAERLEEGGFIVENRPKSGPAGGGLAFHRRELAYGLAMTRLALAFKADVALIDSGTSHCFASALFNLAGIPTLDNFHNTFWPAGFPPQRALARLLNRLNGLYLHRGGGVQLGVSPECQRQAEQLAGRKLRFFQYRAMYAADAFGALPPPPDDWRPFRIVFAGRVERNKGVFDILSMAEKLERARPGAVLFELCGDGGAFPELAAEVVRRGLGRQVLLHGRLDRPHLTEVYRRGHLVIVPTTSGFNEAFAMVAAEAVLMGRPVLSSSVVPACEVLAGAVVLARPDDVDDYVAKILDLIGDDVRYGALCRACLDLRGLFLDPANGFAAALGRALDALLPDRLPRAQVEEGGA